MQARDVYAVHPLSVARLHFGLPAARRDISQDHSRINPDAVREQTPSALLKADLSLFLELGD